MTEQNAQWRQLDLLVLATSAIQRQRLDPMVRAEVTALLKLLLNEYCAVLAKAKEAGDEYPDGFTYTPQMEAACQHIADRSSSAAIAACLTRASIRERAYVTASRAA